MSLFRMPQNERFLFTKKAKRNNKRCKQAQLHARTLVVTIRCSCKFRYLSGSHRSSYLMWKAYNYVVDGFSLLQQSSICSRPISIPSAHHHLLSRLHDTTCYTSNGQPCPCCKLKSKLFSNEKNMDRRNNSDAWNYLEFFRSIWNFV